MTGLAAGSVAEMLAIIDTSTWINAKHKNHDGPENLATSRKKDKDWSSCVVKLWVFQETTEVQTTFIHKNSYICHAWHLKKGPVRHPMTTICELHPTHPTSCFRSLGICSSVAAVSTCSWAVVAICIYIFGSIQMSSHVARGIPLP